MPLNPLLQFSMRYIFKEIGFFELFQFSVPFNIGSNLNVMLPKMKELNFFETSMAYIKFKDDREKASFNIDEFGNYAFKKINSDDYVLKSYEEVIKNLFLGTYDIKNLKTIYSNTNTNELSIENVNDLIRQIAKLHMNADEAFYQLVIPMNEKEKLATSCIWENFENFIGIDKERKLIHLMTLGKN